MKSVIISDEAWRTLRTTATEQRRTIRAVAEMAIEKHAQLSEAASAKETASV